MTERSSSMVKQKASHFPQPEEVFIFFDNRECPVDQDPTN